MRLQTGKKINRFDIYVNSAGGNSEEAFGIYDYLKEMQRKKKIKIRTIAIGRTESAALTVFMAGKERFSYAHTLFMAHKAEIKDKKAIKDYEKKINYCNNYCEKIYKFKLTEKPLIFNAKEALKMGIIHRIIE